MSMVLKSFDLSRLVSLRTAVLEESEFLVSDISLVCDLTVPLPPKPTRKQTLALCCEVWIFALCPVFPTETSTLGEVDEASWVREEDCGLALPGATSHSLTKWTVKGFAPDSTLGTREQFS